MGQFEDLFGELRSAGEVGDTSRVHQVIFQMRVLDLDRYYDEAHSHATTYLNRGQTMNFATGQRLEAVKRWAENVLALDEYQEMLLSLSTSGRMDDFNRELNDLENRRYFGQETQEIDALLSEGERLLKFSANMDANMLRDMENAFATIQDCFLLDSDMRDVIWLVLEEHRQQTEQGEDE